MNGQRSRITDTQRPLERWVLHQTNSSLRKAVTEFHGSVSCTVGIDTILTHLREKAVTELHGSVSCTVGIDTIPLLAGVLTRPTHPTLEALSKNFSSVLLAVVLTRPTHPTLETLSKISQVYCWQVV